MKCNWANCTDPLTVVSCCNSSKYETGITFWFVKFSVGKEAKRVYLVNHLHGIARQRYFDCFTEFKEPNIKFEK